MRTFFKTIQNIFYGVLITLIIAVIGLFVASLMKIPGNIEIKIVKSGSMEPVIKTGGIVIIKPESDYTVGDIITFGEDSKTAVPTTHRIVAIRQDAQATYYTTKGDANNAPEQNETEKRNVIGKVLVTVPYAGYVLNFARQPTGFALLIGFPAALIVIYEIIAIWDETKKLLRKKGGGNTTSNLRDERVMTSANNTTGNSPYRTLELRRQRLMGMGMTDIRMRRNNDMKTS